MTQTLNTDSFWQLKYSYMQTSCNLIAMSTVLILDLVRNFRTVLWFNFSKVRSKCEANTRHRRFPTQIGLRRFYDCDLGFCRHYLLRPDLHREKRPIRSSRLHRPVNPIWPPNGSVACLECKYDTTLIKVQTRKPHRQEMWSASVPSEN